MIDTETIISLAEVRDRFDPDRNGAFFASIVALGDVEEKIHYVSPYGTGCEGGFIAIPEVGSVVLVGSPIGTSEWFYLGTTFFNAPEQAIGGVIPDSNFKPVERADPYNFKARGEPLRYFFKGKTGGGILISEEYNPKYYNVKTEVQSPEGKYISLNDSAGIDSIILDSGNNSRLTLSNMGKPGAFWQSLKRGYGMPVPAAALVIETKGPQKYLNKNSRTDILVNEGTELNLLNNSGGTHKWSPPAEEQYGNVNVQSKQRDVNIFARCKGKDSNGRIFIECLNTEGKGQVIEIETHGTNGDCVIRIRSTGKVEISSDLDIDIDAGKNLNIRAQDNINITANGTLQARSGSDMSLGGGPNINLNPPGGVNPASPAVGSATSHYPKGVTVY